MVRCAAVFLPVALFVFDALAQLLQGRKGKTQKHTAAETAAKHAAAKHAAGGAGGGKDGKKNREAAKSKASIAVRP